MAKAVTERPRRGHGNASKKASGPRIRRVDPAQELHGELSRKLDRRSAAGSHIWDNVMWEIETDCHIGEDRLAYSNRRRFLSATFPIDGPYVHPRTGLIREQRRPGFLASE